MKHCQINDTCIDTVMETVKVSSIAINYETRLSLHISHWTVAYDSFLLMCHFLYFILLNFDWLTNDRA